jgi:hypothetical protein
VSNFGHSLGAARQDRFRTLRCRKSREHSFATSLLEHIADALNYLLVRLGFAIKGQDPLTGSGKDESLKGISRSSWSS